MSPSSSFPVTGRDGRTAPAKTLLTVSITLILVMALAGCGGGEKGDDKESIVLATVGDVEVTAAEYDYRLAKLAENELPRAEDGSAADMSQRDGKLKFLESMTNKEVMVLSLIHI